jgi:hypothetical protein
MTDVCCSSAMFFIEFFHSTGCRANPHASLFPVMMCTHVLNRSIVRSETCVSYEEEDTCEWWGAYI